MHATVLSRVLAASIFVAACAGLAIQFAELLARNSAPASLWIMLGYFTITTNVLAAAVFLAIALNRTVLREDWIVAGTMLSLSLVGVVVVLLLRGALELSGGSAIVDRLLHAVTPGGAVLFWIVCAPKGKLTWGDPMLWAIYPLAYLVYGIARGQATGKYAYPFLDVAHLGWSRVALNAFAIAVCFMVAGYLTVAADHAVARWRQR